MKHTTTSHKAAIFCLWILAGMLNPCMRVFGQADLPALLEQAAKNYPSIAAKQAQANAAKAQLSLEKNTFLPSLNATYEANYATFNNITGMSLPGTTIPISGPPSAENFNDMVAGSGAALTMRWSPVTFGQRSASIEYHRNVYEQQLAGLQDEILQVKFRVAFMYLEIVGTQALIQAYQKNIDRNAFNVKQVASLVAAGIRPAVDSLKFKGELSKASAELYSLQNLLQTQQYELMELLAKDELVDTASSEILLRQLPSAVAPADSLQHPALSAAQHEVVARQARLRQAKRSWLPHIELWGTAYARGSGVWYNGIDNGPTIVPSDGWRFSRYNRGIGAQLTFPILGLSDVKQRNRQQQSLLESSENMLRQTQLSLHKQQQLAGGDLATALQIAQEVPVEYEAQQKAYQALQIRYNTGLVDYTAIILAQYDLLQAEARLKNAYINAWKALLRLAVSKGDMAVFLHQLQNP